jgi:cell division protein FtsQ
MKIYMGFVAALDASGENISHRLSEVDVSNPEDVKAILLGPASGGADTAPGGANAASSGADVLVHFGDSSFLERYREYEQHLAEWRAQYPRLAAVDLRYERQVVLEMQPGPAAPAVDAAAAGAAAPASGESTGAVQAQKAAADAMSHAAAAKATASTPAKTKSPLAAKLTGKPAASASASQGAVR